MSARDPLHELERRLRWRSFLSGPVAQLGARMNGIHEVTGSIPVWSTKLLFTFPTGSNQLKAGAVRAVRNAFPSNAIPSGKNSC
jgi:hypothetical protein